MGVKGNVKDGLSVSAIHGPETVPIGNMNESGAIGPDAEAIVAYVIGAGQVVDAADQFVGRSVVNVADTQLSVGDEDQVGLRYLECGLCVLKSGHSVNRF